MAHEKIYGICESKCFVETITKEQFEFVPKFTYVVDSYQKLLDWANNVEGNDYTSVLIRKNTESNRNVNVGINLTTCGTKVVVGEVGSFLYFNNVDKCLYYDEVPTSSEYYMLNVKVTSSVKGSGFYNCTNLTNCTSTITGYETGTSVYGFNNCINLTNCTSNNAVNAQFGYGTGFYNCTNLTNCTGTGKCTGTNGTGYGFRDCTNLTNCTGTGTGKLYGYGFRDCTNLTNCTGTGQGTGTSSSIGYGFLTCTGVSKCKAGGNCKTSVFNSSYASQSKTETYACADTPEGGFNDTTNPSA